MTPGSTASCLAVRQSAFDLGQPCPCCCQHYLASLHLHEGSGGGVEGEGREWRGGEGREGKGKEERKGRRGKGMDDKGSEGERERRGEGKDDNLQA